MEISKETILGERLRRQRLTPPLETADGYVDLFRLLQPVPTGAWARPGDPPRLFPRTRFDDGAVADRMRARREMVKGRFLGGTIGYVLADDLELYANAFCRPLTNLNDTQRIVFEAVQDVGPLTPRQIKEETDLLNKAIMPALHRLQKAFLVYEDQADSDWERGWYDFEVEWPNVELDESRWAPAAAEVVLRFLKGHVFGTFEQIVDWSQFPKRSLVNLLQEMSEAGRIVSLPVEGLGEGWIRAEDADLAGGGPVPSAFMLHGGDMLCRSHSSELKRRFGEYEVLQYLLIDGAFQGAVLGHWRIGPHDVDDIVVNLPEEERLRRRDEIVAVVAEWYHPPRHHILRYDGWEVGS
jgi:hypothetical protein